MKHPRPSEAIFADGKNARPLAILPEAINVSYPTVPADCVAEIENGVAVLCIDGPLEHRMTWWSNYEAIAIQFKALCEDSAVAAIVLKFNSPGGECAGLNETVRIMQGMKAKAGKPVVGYVDEACYSAAYAIAMVCDEIYLPESGGLGSIGVITAMADVTAMNKKDGIRVEVIASGSKKTDGHPHVALTEGAIKRTRKTVDKLAESFFGIVSESRGLSVETIAGYQAGTFTGQDAVDAGLADGVMSLGDCLTIAGNLFSLPNTPDAPSSGKESAKMARQIAAQKALNDANKALAAAKTDADRALAAARVVAAESTVTLEAKVKKTKTVTTDTHEEEIDDGEADDEDEDEGDDESAEDEDEGEETSASAHLPAMGKNMNAVLQLARKITGKKSVDEVCGALQGMADSYKKTSKLAAEVAQLKADAEAGKVSALVSAGMKAGKLAPSQKAWAKSQSPAALKAYLDAAPKMVHTEEEEHTEARVAGTGSGAVTAEMAKIWRKQGFAEADFPKLLEKLNGTKTMNGAS